MHEILLRRLPSTLGICSLFSLFSSYLTDWPQCICVTKVPFEKFALASSRLFHKGPTWDVFSLPFETFDAHLPNVHVYADD